MPTFWVMPNWFWGGMSKMQLLVHACKISYIGMGSLEGSNINGMRRSLYRLWSSLLQKSCWRFWAFLTRAWGTSFDMHFHKLRRTRNLWHHPSMQVILCEEHKGGMECHIIKARI
jgi:hypothetical protein